MQPLDKEATVMDLRPYLPGAVAHNGDVHPWPFPDGAFDVVMAFQVIEHLTDKAGFFAEARRLGRWCLISYPYRWKAGSACHQGLDDDVVAGWVGRSPDVRQQVGCRMIHVYDWRSHGEA